MVNHRLLALNNRVEQAWNAVDVQRKRRHELIPQLVEWVKGYQLHEMRLDDRRILLRNEQQIAIGEVATAGIASVNAPKVAHSEWRADGLFQVLHEEPIRTEEKMPLARGDYHDIFEDKNKQVDQVA